MNTVRDILRNADPLRHEPDPLERDRVRLRQSVVAAAADVTARPSVPLYSPLALLATVALIVVGIAVGSQMWSRGGATLQAAVRFEVRLAEDQPAAGLREARISGFSGSDRSVYIHQDVIVTNSDIAQSSVVPGVLPSRFSIAVQFNAAGTEKMRRATANHVGKPVAILLDGRVVSAPVLRAPIGASAEISGEYSKADAEQIVTGMGRS